MRRKINRFSSVADKEVDHIKSEDQEHKRIIGRMIEDGSPIYEPNTTASWITYGGAGSGKSTSVSIPALQCVLGDFDRAIVCNDVKSGEMAQQAIEMCVAAGRDVCMIDDSYVLGRDNPYRKRVNPFGNLVWGYQEDSPDLASEIETACRTILPEPDGGLDRNFFFRQVPREFMTFGIMALLRRNLKLATPGGLAALIGDPEIFATVVEIESEEGDETIRGKAKQIRDLRESDETEFTKHYLAAVSALRTFAIGSPIHEAGRDQEISQKELLKRNCITFVVQNQKNAARLGSYYGLHFNAFLSAQLGGDCGKTDLVFDEVANTPAKELIEKVTAFRAYGLRVLYIAQSRADLQRQNSDKLITTLEDNCNIQWLQFGSYEEADRVSKAIGEVDNVQVNVNAGSSNLDFSSTINTGRERIFTPDDLLNLPSSEQILRVAGVGFIHCLKIRQNEIGDSAHYLAENSLEGGRLEPDIKVELPFSIAEQLASRGRKYAGGRS
ncbi:MAG: type IV secretory system conjugative DNA transfer family protein [Pseudomonadota bacterium]